jgi:hypothetical protein
MQWEGGDCIAALQHQIERRLHIPAIWPDGVQSASAPILLNAKPELHVATDLPRP